jgi:signal transduction histidine kinase
LLALAACGAAVLATLAASRRPVRHRLVRVGLAVLVGAELDSVLLFIRLFWAWRVTLGFSLVATAVILLAALVASVAAPVHRVSGAVITAISLVGLTLLVEGIYVVVVLGLGPLPDSRSRRAVQLSMGAAAVVAWFFHPARSWLSDLASRLVYGEPRRPPAPVALPSSGLARLTTEELLLSLLDSLRKTIRLSAAEIWTGDVERFVRVASIPDRRPATFTPDAQEQSVLAGVGVVGNAWARLWATPLLDGRGDTQVRIAPARHSAEVLALLIAERPADGDVFSDQEERFIGEIARELGLNLHNARLDSELRESLDTVRRQADELRASRARLVVSADMERRKIERDLHDGAQQHLVLLAVKLSLARELLARDPEAASQMLGTLAETIKETIDEVREVAHGIYPPLLLESGLAVALRVAGGRSSLDVTVEADAVGRYPSEVEAALYYCCVEALQNASKHASPCRVIIRLHEEEDVVRFEVSDDGPGFVVDAAQAGHGFVNMSDRMGAIGGTVEWKSGRGMGTCVSGAAPVRPAPLTETPGPSPA